MTAGSVAVPAIVPLKVFSAGGRKNHVDTTTKIELTSDTEGVMIYYTINGRRPAPFDRPRPRHTLEYRAPFTLDLGKVTIKAMAASRDGLRESSVVTKTFLVKEAEQEEDEEEEMKEDEKLSRVPSPQRPSTSPVPPPLSLSAQLRQRISLEKAKPPIPPSTSFSSNPSSPNKKTAVTTTRSVSVPRPVTSTPLPRSPILPSPPIIPRCSYCKTQYNIKSGHVYCSQCGACLPSLPHMQRHPQTKMSVCSDCGASVQSDIQHCPVCDSTAVVKPRTPCSIRGQSKAPINQDVVMCSECGTRNTSSHDLCITCDTPLHLPSSSQHPPQTHTPSSPHPPCLNTTSSDDPLIMTPMSVGQCYAMCGRCGRVNVSDARFCDWCGATPAQSTVAVICGECSTAVDWLACHCTNCGAIIKAPPRSGVEHSSTMKMPSGIQLGTTEGWIPVVDIVDEKPVTCDRSSQTDRFYPSGQTLGKKKEALERQVSVQVAGRDRVRRLNRYSPGKGLWRVQVDHVCDHLKAHALSSQAFQNDIASPVMGKLVDSKVMTTDSTVDITLSFSLKSS